MFEDNKIKYIGKIDKLSIFFIIYDVIWGDRL